MASPIFERLIRKEAPESAVITLAALSIFVASAITGITELHPVLGAFIAGFFLPDKVREIASHRFDQTATLVLMPFFFLNTGLDTDFSFFDPAVWYLFAISSTLCVVGKTIGHGTAARLSGEGWPFASAMGLLLQAKGLMGLIVIVVFLEKEVVSPLMFSAAVFMCMFSTGLSTPAYRVLYKIYGKRLQEGDRREAETPILTDGEEVAPAPSVSSTPWQAAPAIATLEFDDNHGGTVRVDKQRTVIGRHTDADVRVNDIRVSRHHALLVEVEPGKFEIHNQMADRTEPNPILINGEVREHAQLKDGDRVSLGGVSFTFRKAAAARTAASPVSKSPAAQISF